VVMAEQADTVAVTDESGAVIGSVTKDDLLR
jgi:CBS domain containing-hemolysin-like protein